MQAVDYHEKTVSEFFQILYIMTERGANKWHVAFGPENFMNWAMKLQTASSRYDIEECDICCI